jgi:hypothetical protein
MVPSIGVPPCITVEINFPDQVPGSNGVIVSIGDSLLHPTAKSTHPIKNSFPPSPPIRLSVILPNFAICSMRSKNIENHPRNKKMIPHVEQHCGIMDSVTFYSGSNLNQKIFVINGKLLISFVLLKFPFHKIDSDRAELEIIGSYLQYV